MELWAVYDIFIISTVGTPPPHKYEFVDTENVTDFDKDEKPKTVRSLVDYFENGAFSQSDMSAEVLSQTRAFCSRSITRPFGVESEPAVTCSSVSSRQTGAFPDTLKSRCTGTYFLLPHKYGLVWWK